MADDWIWVNDPETGEPVPMKYSEMEDEAKRVLLRPVGGFIFPANAFIQLDLPQVPYYIKDWLPKRGKAEIYAPRKSGKTYLMSQIARSIGSGEPVFNLPTTQGKVLFVQFELGLELLQERLKQTGKDYPNVFVGSTFNLKLDTESGFSMLQRAMEAVQPDVLILDPLYKMLSGDENESHDIVAIVDKLDRLIDSFTCSILLVHHAGKDISRGGRGSSSLEDWVDSSIEMRRISKAGEPLRIRLTPRALRHAALTDTPIEAEMHNYEFHMTGGTPTVKDLVAKFIREKHEGGGNIATRGEILRSGIGSNASVQDAVNALTDEGVIDKIGRGEYKQREAK